MTAGQFAARPIVMLESPAMRVLSLAARKALERIEIEHAHHGGADNGKLPVTYRDFEKWGVHTNAVAPALRELVALGFVEVTRKGYGGAAEMRVPSLYRLTYRPAWNATAKDGDGTHEYLTIKTDEEAEAIAATARKGADPRNVERAKNHCASLTSCEFPPSEREGERQKSRPEKVRVQAHPRNARALSRFSERSDVSHRPSRSCSASSSAGRDDHGVDDGLPLGGQTVAS